MDYARFLDDELKLEEMEEAQNSEGFMPIADVCPKCKSIHAELIEHETYRVPDSKWSRRNGVSVQCRDCNFSGPIKKDGDEAIEYWNAILTAFSEPEAYIWFTIKGTPEAIGHHLDNRKNRRLAQAEFQKLLRNLRPNAGEYDIVVEADSGKSEDPNLVLTVEDFATGIATGSPYEVIISKYYVASLIVEDDIESDLTEEDRKELENFLNSKP